MRRLPISSALSILLLCFTTPLKAAPQAPNQTPPAPATTAAVYPDSADGLKHFFDDIFAAMNSGDYPKASALFSTLEIPAHNAWFFKMFGPEEGPRLDARYVKLLPNESGAVQGRLETALVHGGPTKVEAGTVPYPTPGPLGRAAVQAMVEPVPIYSVSAGDPKANYLTWIGEFVYVDGGFRLLDQDVFQALSTAPSAAPRRIRLGGNAQMAKLIHKVNPVYPAEAKRQRIEGDVVLTVIIGEDGKPNAIKPVSGDPLLIWSAVNAVRQWLYQPTLLNGEPVEVDTTVSIQFRL